MSNHPPLNLTQHARKRMAQRNVTANQILYILCHGSHFHRAGVLLVHLRQKDIPLRERAKERISRLEGVTVVLNSESSVVLTVWRNRNDGLHHIRHKACYGR